MDRLHPAELEGYANARRKIIERNRMADQENIQPKDVLTEDRIRTLVTSINSRIDGVIEVSPDPGGHFVSLKQDGEEILARYLSPNQTLKVLKLVSATL